MNLWLLAFAVLAAVPKAFSQDAGSASALQAVAEMPPCAVCAFPRIHCSHADSATNFHVTARVSCDVDYQVTMSVDKYNLRMHKSDAATKYASVCFTKLHHQRSFM
jgi:hypothetical protein